MSDFDIIRIIRSYEDLGVVSILSTTYNHSEIGYFGETKVRLLLNTTIIIKRQAATLNDVKNQINQFICHCVKAGFQNTAILSLGLLIYNGTLTDVSITKQDDKFVKIHYTRKGRKLTYLQKFTHITDEDEWYHFYNNVLKIFSY